MLEMRSASTGHRRQPAFQCAAHARELRRIGLEPKDDPAVGQGQPDGQDRDVVVCGRGGQIAQHRPAQSVQVEIRRGRDRPFEPTEALADMEVAPVDESVGVEDQPIARFESSACFRVVRGDVEAERRTDGGLEEVNLTRGIEEDRRGWPAFTILASSDAGSIRMVSNVTICSSV